MARCPSAESSQSMKACPSAAFTLGNLSGFTRMTPYWLKSSGSPSTTILKSPLLPKDIQVARSLMV